MIGELAVFIATHSIATALTVAVVTRRLIQVWKQESRWL